MRHLTEDEISRYITGACEAEERETIGAHLQDCESCFDDYTYAARVHAGVVAGEAVPAVSAGVAISGATIAVDARRASPARAELLRPRRIKRIWPALAAAAVTVVLAGTVWIDSNRAPGPAPIPDDILRPIEAAMSTVSNRTYFVVPGTENSLDGNVAVYRGDFWVRDPEVVDAVSRASDAIKEQGDNPGLLRHLIGGMLASGMHGGARLLANKAVERYPDDADVAVLCGLAAYFDGKRDVAVAGLRSLLQRNPHNSVAAVNLAAMLEEQGDHEEARRLLREVSSRNPETSLGDRARWLLDEFDL